MNTQSSITFGISMIVQCYKWDNRVWSHANMYVCMYVCAYTYIYNNNCSKLLTITLSPLPPPLSIHFTTYYKHLLSITIHKYPEWRLQHQGYAQVPYQEDAMLLSSSLSSPAPPWITLLSLRVLTLLSKIDLHMKNSKFVRV